MPNTTEPSVRWQPQTPADRDLVLDELNEILCSHHFRNSKRYPAFLQYVVKRALDGHSDQLKERTLGVEVFHRAPDYDTNTDPVVRFSAGEVRKRIAQFYHERGGEPAMEISLPLGSYAPEFRLRPIPPEVMDGTSLGPIPRKTDDPEIDVGPAAISAHAGTPHSRRLGTTFFRWRFFWPLVVLVTLTPTGIYALHRKMASTVADTLWRPVLKSPGSVQIVISTGQHDVQSPPDPVHEMLAAQLHGAYHHISVCDAVAVSHLAAVLGNHSKGYEIKEAELTSLKDIRERSVILIGAYNNLWTLRLMEPLRFHFVKEGHGVRIVDTQNPELTSWAVDYSRSAPSAVYDYAIVARYVDPTTNGNILIIAGIGAYGTEAASEAVANPYELKNLLAALPRGWENRNLELVIRTPVINGENGPANVVSSATW